ncbi:hypothetical protein GPECTOR_37g210 [Gonium pectorale]|uniref:F-box domain-containing protein n=1 Tax=Gonium pectorale TaxID=33097 RepID=A0A150GBI8_GONPE|nr:hypothetical protein GPECTOR_37g210 [Gonium pectorale]|eukprot:KXZ47204.1 hypothetical protein GPECTOR_37g210 [Gonium pectorale]
MASAQARHSEYYGVEAEDSSQDGWHRLPPEIWDLIVSHLDGNEVAGTVRAVNKAAAAQFRGPQHTTLHLSQPVPHHAFAAHWLAPGATRALTLPQRRRLLCLTAASGSVPNLAIATKAAGCMLTVAVFEAAVSAGQLYTCQWLRDHDCPMLPSKRCASNLLALAAGGGHQHVCAWLLSLPGIAYEGGEPEAARAGHTSLLKWFEERPQCDRLVPNDLGLLCGVAHGCDLAMLKRYWWTLVGAEVLTSVGDDEAGVGSGLGLALAAAAGSPTPDWAAKTRGGPYGLACCEGDFVMLHHLHRRGVPWGEPYRLAALVAPLSALRWLLLETDCPLDLLAAAADARRRAKRGSVRGAELLRLLKERYRRQRCALALLAAGGPDSARSLLAAGEAGGERGASADGAKQSGSGGSGGGRGQMMEAAERLPQGDAEGGGGGRGPVRRPSGAEGEEGEGGGGEAKGGRGGSWGGAWRLWRLPVCLGGPGGRRAAAGRGAAAGSDEAARASPGRRA